MSGRKYSEYWLQREREEKMRLLQELRNLHAALEGYIKSIKKLLDTASEGLKSSFPQETQQAERFLATTKVPNISEFNMNTSNSKITSTRDSISELCRKAGDIFKALSIAYTKKADELGKRRAGELAEVEQLLSGTRDLIASWFKEERVAQFESSIEDGHRMLESEQYHELESKIKELKRTIEEQAKEAEKLQEKHEKRLYFLQAVRQVCKEMGFGEIEEPHHEKEGDLSSPIVFLVDTYDLGLIKFHLALDKVTAHSEIVEGKCFEEFGELSRFLIEEFGFKQGFTDSDGNPIPLHKKKGELQEPGDTGRYATAG